MRDQDNICSKVKSIKINDFTILELVSLPFIFFGGVVIFFIICKRLDVCKKSTNCQPQMLLGAIGFALG